MNNRTAIDTGRHIDGLIRMACAHGASQAARVDATDIVVNDHLAALCRRSACPVYGLAASCPPHVGGPPAFRCLLRRIDQAIAFKIDVPTPILLGEERHSVYRCLHTIAARVEQTAIAWGWTASRGFAGGSCKSIFCADLTACPVVVGTGTCRHPDLARPSMSGYGIDVSRLMAAVGWPMQRITRDTSADAVPMGALVGLVLIG